MSVKKIIDIDERWEKNIPHSNKSKILFDFLKEYDRSFCNNYFYWKSGGDGDNGELLMYQLDEYFDSDNYKQHEEEIKKQLLDRHYYEIKHKIIKELGSDLIRHIEENGYDDNTIQDFLKERGVE